MGKLDKATIRKELQLSTARSGGAGGQHVNKVETKVILHFNINASEAFSEVEKRKLRERLSRKLAEGGVLVLTSERGRSQSTNRKDVVKKLFVTLEKALIDPKKRKKTRPPKSAIESRLKAKKRRSEIKEGRKKIQ